MEKAVRYKMKKTHKTHAKALQELKTEDVPGIGTTVVQIVNPTFDCWNWRQHYGDNASKYLCKFEPNVDFKKSIVVTNEGPGPIFIFNVEIEIIFYENPMLT
jgi:hypothetical protein